jgi:hypothetical protein
MTLRWADYVMGRDDTSQSVEELWRAALPNGGVTLFVLGAGFDPRAVVALVRFLDLAGPQLVRVLSIALATTTADRLTVQLAQANRGAMEAISTKPNVDWRTLPYPDVAEASSAGLLLARSVLSDGHLNDVRYVVVDVSALPGGIYFPLIGALLQYCDEGKLEAEIQVFACDNPELDEAIVVAGLGQPATVGGFKHGLDLETSRSGTRVWAPVLGSGHKEALAILSDRLRADETCPVLPFPARRPRLADDILLEYRQLLFETVFVEPRNFIYGDETNPFDLYRQLSSLQERYRTNLEPIGDSTVVVSTHASKLLSVGALLAAYEAHLPVVSVPAADYALAQDVDVPRLAEQNRLVCLWLHGAPYR